jgi:hypothetical protein
LERRSFFLAQASLDLNPSHLSLPHSLGWQAQLLVTWALVNFLPGLATNCDPPHLSLPRS